MRLPSVSELQLIKKFAEKLAPIERNQLLLDASNAMIQSAVADSSRLVFHISGYQRPSDGGQCLYAVEGKMLDADSAELDVLLFADKNGRLLELEFIRYDPGGLIGLCWNTLKVY